MSFLAQRARYHVTTRLAKAYLARASLVLDSMSSSPAMCVSSRVWPTVAKRVLSIDGAGWFLGPSRRSSMEEAIRHRPPRSTMLCNPTFCQQTRLSGTVFGPSPGGTEGLAVSRCSLAPTGRYHRRAFIHYGSYITALLRFCSLYSQKEDKLVLAQASKSHCPLAIRNWPPRLAPLCVCVCVCVCALNSFLSLSQDLPRLQAEGMLPLDGRTVTISNSVKALEFCIDSPE